MTLHFTVNLVFWQLLKQYQPKLAKTIKPELKRIQQTFPVRMFNKMKDPLQMPSVLSEIVQKLYEYGKKTRPIDIKSPSIFSRFESNIVTVVAGALACISSIAILILSIKQFRLQSLVSSLGLVSLISPAKVHYWQIPYWQKPLEFLSF